MNSLAIYIFFKYSRNKGLTIIIVLVSIPGRRNFQFPKSISRLGGELLSPNPIGRSGVPKSSFPIRKPFSSFLFFVAFHARSLYRSNSTRWNRGEIRRGGPDDVTGEVTRPPPTAVRVERTPRRDGRGNREREREREGDQPSRGELITGFHEACPGARAKKAGFHAAEAALSSSSRAVKAGSR